MKKLWKTQKFRLFQKRRQRRAEPARRRKDLRQTTLRLERRERRKKNRKPKIDIIAPTRFSLVRDPETTLKFLKEIKEKSLKWNLFIRLRDVVLIDPEAVAAFVAVMESTENTYVGGDQPLEQVCRRRLHDFGFFERVRGISPMSDSKGKIRMEHSGQKVEGKIAGEIMGFGMQKLGRDDLKHGPTYNILIESMANTFQHAGRTSGWKTWWAAVYYDEREQKACFTVVDVGVGILDSPTLKQRVAFGKSKGHFSGLWTTQGEKLRDLLEGKIPSRTGERHRGRGLPSMYTAYKSGRISNLLVVSNRAFADAASGVFKQLRHDFRGTIIYWEVRQEGAQTDEIESSRGIQSSTGTAIKVRGAGLG